jgi:DNA-binding transcriptional LysR family regulator
VRPGRLFEQPTSGPGVERRAFGEFIGPRGELASYAFGWTTESTELIGRLTVGIGAGNPGGGSFHAVIFAKDESYAMALVDEPFARVPEGGPDLSRDEALAHEDLPFVWFVADEAMARDPRAWRMRHWVLSTSAVATPEVLDKAEPVLLLQHDEDGIWQAIGSTSAGTTGGVVHLWHLVEEDLTLVPVLDLAPGEAASRHNASSPWRRTTTGHHPPQRSRRRFGRRGG